MAHIPFLNFSFSYLRHSLLPQNNSLLPQNYIPEGINLLNYQCNVFWSSIAIIIAVFFKKRNNCGIRLHDADLQHSLIKEKYIYIYVHMFFFSFLCSGIPDLALGILKMLICEYFRDVLQPAI